MIEDAEKIIEDMDPEKAPVDLTEALDALVKADAIPSKEDISGRCKAALEHILGVEAKGFSVLILKPDGAVTAVGQVDSESPEDIRRLSRAMAISIGNLLG